MKKVWFKEQAYRLSDEQVAEMNANLKNELIHPHGTGKRPVKDGEDICLQWLEDNEIDPVNPVINPMAIVIMLMGVACVLVDYLFMDSIDAAFGQLLITALTTGAGINTITPAQSQMESDILIGDVDTAMPCRGVKVNIDGNTTMDVQGSQPLISVLSKLSQFIAGGGVIGMIIKIGTGRMICKAGQVTFTNDAATTPAVYWNSQRSNGRAINARTTTINPNSNQTFSGVEFAYLAVTNPANISSFDMTFADGLQQNLSVVEADALFAKTNETEANGRLDALVTCFDNTARTKIASVRINVAGTAVTVMTVI